MYIPEMIGIDEVAIGERGRKDLDMSDAMRRATAAYYRSGETQNVIAQPVEDCGRNYVRLVDEHGNVVADYRVRNDGMLKRLKRIPAAMRPHAPDQRSDQRRVLDELGRLLAPFEPFVTTPPGQQAVSKWNSKVATYYNSGLYDPFDWGNDIAGDVDLDLVRWVVRKLGLAHMRLREVVERLMACGEQATCGATSEQAANTASENIRRLARFDEPDVKQPRP